MEGAKTRLHMFEANLLEEGSFDKAIHGCCAVFHTASPVLFATPNPQEGYILSKTLAEIAAWKYAKENGMDLISINPALVIGPMLQQHINWSSDVVFNLVNGKSETYMNLAYGWVHVKDVAEAHIRAFEIPSANGRYILSETVVHYSQAVDILRQLYPTLKLPTKCENEEPPLPTYKISKDKVASLGIDYIPLKVALKETVDFFIERNLISV
ncbi:hypothetical protein RND81_06G186200 [Saponaria officinalis]|uniref:NAD-dependent epimerase/dehydratase domain-containing protein n=1 Tax=Saponaria officinalis TaxID=3572 RepID=A0AAW1KCI4_SAPOF